jgi:transposase-like protein
MIHLGERWRFAMSIPVALRTDFTGLQLRVLAKQSKDAAFARRLLALAEIFDGGSRSDAARIGGVGPQTIRDWVPRFNAKGPEGLKDGKAPGQPSLLRALPDHVESRDRKGIA